MEGHHLGAGGGAGSSQTHLLAEDEVLGLLQKVPVWNVERPYLTGQAIIQVWE